MNKQLNDLFSCYLLIDRSGSMANISTELLSSVNTYVAGLSPSTLVTVAIFDSQGYDVIRRNVSASMFAQITTAEAAPRGSTPLLDSLGKIIATLKDDQYNRSVLVVMTDGAENCSLTQTYDGISKQIEAIKEGNRAEVIFFGCNFADISKETSRLKVDPGYSINMSTSNFADVARGLSAKTMAFAATGAAMAYSVAEKADAVKPTPGAGPKS